MEKINKKIQKKNEKNFKNYIYYLYGVADFLKIIILYYLVYNLNKFATKRIKISFFK